MNETKASRYQRRWRQAQAGAVLAGGAALALAALTPVSRALADWSAGLGVGLGPATRDAVAVSALATLLLAAWEIAALPAALFLVRSDRRTPIRAGVVDDVLLAQAQAAGIALPICLTAGLVWRGAVVVGGSAWWIVAAVAGSALLAAAMHAGPTVLGRLASTASLGDAGLASRLDALAQSAGVPVRGGILEWRVGSGAGRTALVAGAGDKRRILVASDLARDWSADEVAVVVAHELAHHRHRDLWRAFALDAGVLAVATLAAHLAVLRLGPALGLSGPEDLAALPLLVLAGGAAWLAATPLRHAQSRLHERRADAMALQLTGGADAFRTAIRRLGESRLAEERPSTVTRWLFHRHPPMAERIAHADAYQRAQRRAS
jgi:STE24 endopeptidase